MRITKTCKWKTLNPFLPWRSGYFCFQSGDPLHAPCILPLTQRCISNYKKRNAFYARTSHMQFCQKCCCFKFGCTFVEIGQPKFTCRQLISLFNDFFVTLPYRHLSVKQRGFLTRFPVQVHLLCFAIDPHSGKRNLRPRTRNKSSAE